MSLLSKTFGWLTQAEAAVRAGFADAGALEVEVDGMLDKLLSTEAGHASLRTCAEQFARSLVPPKPVFVAKPPKVVKEHPLRKKFKTTKEAIKAGAYPDGHDYDINDTSYPVRDGMQEDVDLFGLDVNESFDHDPTTTELLALFAEHGYERPVYEDGLRDGAEWSGESYDRPFVYLHIPDVNSSVLVRYRWHVLGRLDRRFGSLGSQWGRRHCVFFVRRKSKS